MCGVIGISSRKPVAGELYEGLINLQHRGQDSTGIATFNGRFHVVRGVGYVREAYNQSAFTELMGTMGIAQTRYSTAGSATQVGNAQPFITNSAYGIALVHNGNLTNYPQLRKELQENDHFHCNSDSDTEALLGVLATELEKVKESPDFFGMLTKAMEKVYARVHGGYAVVAVIAGKGLIAFRDPNGIRPLVMGQRKAEDGSMEYVFSSENTPFTPLGFEYVGDLEAGELVFVDTEGKLSRKRVVKKEFTPDVFEYVYFARPDAVLNNVSVYRARLRMGQNLAARWKELHPDIMPDLVVPVPFTSNPIALAFAHEIGVRYSEALYRNIFIGRTFIMPGQDNRAKSVRRKLSPQAIELEGKDVLLVDDSIVRGTTTKEVIEMVRHAGARKVYFASACPPIKYPDFYGIDIPTKDELIAAKKSEDEIRDFIGADLLVYQSIDGLSEAIMRKGEHEIDRLSMPYLDGWYVTGDIDEARMEEVKKSRTEERAYD